VTFDVVVTVTVPTEEEHDASLLHRVVRLYLERAALKLVRSLWSNATVESMASRLN
jgi:hypothetical protein